MAQIFDILLIAATLLAIFGALAVFTAGGHILTVLAVLLILVVVIRLVGRYKP